MTRAAIWDMDGTLVDTAELHFVAWQATCRERGRDSDRADCAATVGRRNPEILQYLFGDRFDETEVARIGERKEEMYRAEAKHGVTLLPGVEAILAALHDAGWEQSGGSSTTHANLTPDIDTTGIA